MRAIYSIVRAGHRLVCVVAILGLATAAIHAAEFPAATPSPIAELRAEIARHDELYHRKAAPVISDAEYDGLKRRLRSLETQFPAAAAIAGSALIGIGDDRTGLFATRHHRTRMLSLEKGHTEADLRAFHARLVRALGSGDISYVIEPKFDGFAVSVTYEKGVFVRAVTRGDGTEGDDITTNVRRIRGVPGTLRTVASDGTVNALPDVIELRGEIYVSWPDFARLNATREAAGEPPFATPRNLAAGTIRQTDPAVVEARELEIVFHGVGACVPGSALPRQHREFSVQVGRWGLRGVPEFRIARGADELWATVQAFGRAREGWPYPTDGLVIKLDDLAAQQELGATETAPRWALAYKFASPQAETTVLGITLQVGRTGVLTPVAELAPVEIGGVTVARASLHNRDEIAREDIRIGDTVRVERAGEIIPSIVGVNRARRPASAEPFEFPASCPSCAATLGTRTGEVAVRCPNLDCPAQVRRRIEHFVSEDGVGIVGLGPAAIDALVAAGRINDAADLYGLKREDFLRIVGAGPPEAGRLQAAIETSKTRELRRFIQGLGIPRVGAVAAREVARRHRSLAVLLAAAEGSDPADRVIATYLAEPRHRRIVERLIAAGVKPPPGDDGAGVLAGRVFVLTGTLPNLTRAQAMARIEAAGGIVAGGITRATSHVVVGVDPGVKLEQARALGVEVLDEAGFVRLLAGE